MQDVRVRLITNGGQLPEMACADFFHSAEFFLMAEQTPRYEPCMAVAEDGGGHVVAHLLGVICRHRTLLPPWVYSHARLHGEGEYAAGTDKNALFGLMLDALTRHFRRKRCLFIECSEISKKMFGYRHFKRNGYFSIPWQEIHNSLHSKSPEQRLDKRVRRQLRSAAKRGAETSALTGKDDLHAFYRLLRRYFLAKGRRYIPHERIFDLMSESGRSKTFATTYKGKVIGGCVCIYSGGNAYLWYLAARRKSYHHLHPAAMSVWAAIKDAHRSRCRHICFLDAGLPFESNPFREFILRFGGKPVAKFHWFRLPIPYINKMLSWRYNDR